MNTQDCIKKRRSIRAYAAKPVEREKLEAILEAIANAPTAGNLQDIRAIVVRDKKRKSDIAEACLNQIWIEQAPIVIVLATEPAKAERMYGKRGMETYIKHNAAAAAENALLAATAQGLASCWVGAFEEGMLRRATRMGDGVLPQVVITIGYADEEPPKLEKLGVESITFIETWGNKADDPLEHLGKYSQKVRRAVEKGTEAAQQAGEKAKQSIEELKKKLT